MESSKKNILDIFLIIFILVSLIFGFYMLNKDSFKKVYSNNDFLIKENVDINEVIEEYKKNYNVISINKINDSLTCLLTADDKGKVYNSFILDNNTGNAILPESLFVTDKEPELKNKIKELLSRKYAKFIVDGISIGSGSTIYEFKENELVLHYRDFVFSNEYDKDILLHVNYNEINDYLRFEHTLDENYSNEDGSILDNNKVTIAFSFDDGPNGENTYEVLSILNDYKMTATFFMVGNKMYNQSDVVKTVYNSSCEVGSHSYSHINMKKVSMDKIKDEFATTSKVFTDVTGGKITLARPPYGAYTDEIIKDLPYSFITWNVDTDDWKYRDTDRIVNHILSHIEDGNIILMHDTYKTTVEAVRKVAPILYNKDIQVVSVSKLAEIKNAELETGKAYLYFK